MNTVQQQRVPMKLAIGLGAIGALGPSAVDMYLSSLPEIARDYDAGFASVQLTLIFFLLAMGAGQLLFGPFVDAYGRRRPLLIGLLVFIFGWRAVMLTLAIFGMAVLINSWLNLPETLATEKREPLRLGAACRTYLAIGSDRRFLLPTLAVAAVFFSCSPISVARLWCTKRSTD